MAANTSERAPNVVIVNINLQSNPIVNYLALYFKVKISKNTPPNTLQFPTFRKSCLVLNPRLFTLQSMERVKSVLKLMNHPFIMMVSAGEQPITVGQTPRLILGIKKGLKDEPRLAKVLVSSALDHRMAMDIIKNILTSNTGKFVSLLRTDVRKMILGALDKENQRIAMVNSCVCEDRADAILLFFESPSFRKIGQRMQIEGHNSRVKAIRYLKEDAPIVPL